MEENTSKRTYEDMICSYLKGELSAEENSELINWIKLDKANKRYFDECAELWVTTKSVSGNPGYNAMKGFWNFRQKIYAAGHLHNSAESDKISPFRKALRYAAVAAAAFAIGGLLFFHIGNKNIVYTSQTINEIVVPMGSKAEFSLSDGTVVTLNAGSTIKVDPSFGTRERIIELEGEGYFKVAKDETKPFIVKTPYLNVTALGTEFNIKAYTVDETIETLLVSGSVKIEPTSDGSRGEITILKPSEMLTFYKEDSRIEQVSTRAVEKERGQVNPVKVDSKNAVTRLIKENVNIEPVVSWKEDRWIIEQKSLSEIAIDLERKFNVKIIFESERLKTFRFTGIIMAEPIEQVLELMSETSPISFRLKGNVVTLSENQDLIEVHKDLYVKP